MIESTWRFSDLRIQVFIERFINTDEWRQHRPLGDDDAYDFRSMVYDLKQSTWLRSITHDIWWHDQAAFDCAKAAFRYANIKQYNGMPSLDKTERLSQTIQDKFRHSVNGYYLTLHDVKQDEMALSVILKGIPLAALIDLLFHSMEEQRIPYSDSDKDKLLTLFVQRMLPDSEMFAKHILSIHSGINSPEFGENSGMDHILFSAEASDICSIIREGIALSGANYTTAMYALINDVKLRRSLDFVAKPKTSKWVTNLINTYCIPSFNVH